jgi:ribosomal-protein-alanine N-acetyltransferase
MVAVLQSHPVIRPMGHADLAGVLAAEQASYPYPWSRRIFRDCLRVGYCCLVAEIGGRVQGHGIMLASAGEAHILNVCVHPGVRRRGIARAMLDELMGIACRAGAEAAYLEVRPSNEGAIALYRGAGFQVVGRRADYYPAAFGREDALVMARMLEARADGPLGAL